jgi:hypothetical protein
MIDRVRLKRHIESLSILDAMDDPAIFGRHFQKDSWSSWRGFLAALFALKVDEFGWRAFRKCTGRSEWPTAPAKEGYLICGRRSGKSFVLSLIAVFLACFRDWKPFLNVGERAIICCVAADKKQAAILLRYCRALLKHSPMLQQLIENETADTIALKNKVSIEIITSSMKLARGRAYCAVLLDELAFWTTDENSPELDSEIVAAIRPGMAQFGEHAILLAASSPYARKGELWNSYRKYFGKDGPVLVWQAETRRMNPTIAAAVVDEAMQRDPASAQAEYLAQFRTDVETFVSREAVEACVPHGLYERSHWSSLRYVAFCDPSGGSADSFTLSVAHQEREQAFVDVIREVRPPFSPELVVTEFAAVLKSYQINKIMGDRYAGEWPREQFRKHGITYEPSAKAKSDLYVALLPLLNSRRVELLDSPRLTAQLIGLERRTARSGRDSIDHAPGGHDDLANAVAGALVGCSVPKQQIRVYSGGAEGRPAVEIDPRTGRKIEPERTRIRVVRVTEQEASAVRGVVHGKWG